MIPATAEIVIIGGGVMGCSLAFQLALRGARPVLLERKHLCSGETAKSGGFVQTHWESLDEVRLIAYSREVFRNWSERVGGDCQFKEIGYLHTTGPDGEESVREVHQMLLDEGLESTWLSPIEMKRLQPLLRVDDLVGGTYEATSGWANPLSTTLAFGKRAAELGATLCEGVRALQIAHRQGRIIGVETDQGFISSPKVVLMAGPWTPQLHPFPAVPLPILAKRGQVCYMNRPMGQPRKEVAFYDVVTGLYTHPDGDTNLVGVDYYFDEIWEPDSYHRQVDDAYLERAHASLVHRFPALATARPVSGLVGVYDFTPDGHPIVEANLGLDGYYVAAGFSGAGFKSSPALGLGISELVLDGRAHTVNLDFLKLERFQQGSPHQESETQAAVAEAP